MTRYDVLDDRTGRLADRTAAPQEGPRRGKPTRRPRSSNARRLRVLGWISAIMTLVVVSTSLVAYAEWRHLWGNIQKENVNGLLGKRPPKYNSAMNILLIGSDSRAGSNKKFGQGIQGARSDTMILMHISPQRTGATLISFPRDSVVSTVACRADGMGHTGQQANQQVEMLNETFGSGGAPCTWKTLETLTGIRIDHFIEIDFSGFQSMVNAVGGVTVCLPEAIHDPASKLNLSAGVHHVDGAQALAFVRERHVGHGSDLQRIQRQQFFMASLTKRVTTSNMLGDPGKLLSPGQCRDAFAHHRQRARRRHPAQDRREHARIARKLGQDDLGARRGRCQPTPTGSTGRSLPPMCCSTRSSSTTRSMSRRPARKRPHRQRAPSPEGG